ncbi:MAG: tetratricopeptide repeat protein [Chlamydiota bacterium]
MKSTLLTFIATTFLITPSLQSQGYESTIIPKEDWISDETARKEYAELLFYLGENRKALKIYQQVVEDYPQDPKAFYELGKLYLATSQYPKAITTLNQALDLLSGTDDEEPLRSEIILELGHAYQWSQQYTKAIKIYKKLLQDLPTPSLEIRESLADTYAYAGEYNKSLRLYRRIWEDTQEPSKIRKKIALTTSWSKNYQDALPLLLEYHRQHPKDQEVSLEIINLYLATSQHQEAAQFAEQLAKKFPENPEILIGLAKAEAALGNYTPAQELYFKASKLSTKTYFGALSRLFSVQGDFYQAEQILRDYLGQHPDDQQAQYELAMVLTDTDRYSAAKAILRQLSRIYPKNLKYLRALAEVSYKEKNFTQAASYASDALDLNPQNPQLLTLLGDAQLRSNHPQKALATYQELQQIEGYQVRALNKIGLLYRRENKLPQAQKAWQQALESNPDDPVARFYLTGTKKASSTEYLEQLLANPKNYHPDLLEWARLYAKEGLYSAAIKVYRHLLEGGYQTLQTSLELSLVYASDGQYQQALNLLDKFEQNYKENYKILLYKARFLSWARQYHESLALYQKLDELNPKDPIPRLEMARVADWAKLYQRSSDYYETLLTPSVDEQLLKFLKNQLSQITSPPFNKDFKQLQQTSPKHAYRGFERIMQNYRSGVYKLPKLFQQQLETTLNSLYPAYKFQKKVALEYQSKNLKNNGQLYADLKVLKKLIAFAPNNQEAYFDLAQVQCRLGLCYQARQSYQNLLVVSPNHGLAHETLAKSKLKDNPYLNIGHGYWREGGRGELSGLTRNTSQGSIGIPILCQNQVKLSKIFWHENFQLESDARIADGFSIEVNSRPNTLITTQGSYQHKTYRRQSAPLHSGYASLYLNLHDKFKPGAGYIKSNMIGNIFSWNQRLQANTYWLSIESIPIRNLTLSGQLRKLKYNDNNKGEHHTLLIKYGLTDHPRILSLQFDGSYRNTDKQNISLFTAGSLTDITHPYWTPQSYTSYAITLEWLHDISKKYVCGLDLHTYNIEITVGNDSEDNKMWKNNISWHYEFLNRWTVDLSGMIHRSRTWDADQLLITCKYRF